MENGKSKRLIEGKSLNLNDHSRISPILTEIVLSSKYNNLSIHAWRIMGVILGTLKTNQIFDKKQLSIFDKEFGNINRKTDSVQFSFLWKDFLPPDSRNYSEAEQGLEELASYAGKHSFVNEAGDNIKVISSIIYDVIINQNQNGLKFSMSLTWYKIFLEIYTYNKFPNEIIFKISSMNVFVWYFYLKKLPNRKKTLEPLDGYGPYSLEFINEKFNTTHKHWSKVEEKLLRPIRKTLDGVADISFNYKIVDKKLWLVTYEPKGAVPIAYKNEEELKISRTLKYQRKKNDLNDTEVAILGSLYKKYSYETVYKAISRKESLNDKTGKSYVEEVHRLIQKSLQ